MRIPFLRRGTDRAATKLQRLASCLGLAAGTQLLFSSAPGRAGPPYAAPCAVLPAALGKRSTAKDVVDALAPGRPLAGRVAVVTGGNSGIGVETVKALAYAGCRVVLASRSVEAGENAVEEEVKREGLGAYSVPDADVTVKRLDLADLGSVASFASEVLATEERVDYLVLNAGVMALPELQRTADGFEMQMGVNHFGHALLARLLRPKLEVQEFPSRIVSLASTAHKMASSLDVSNLHYTRSDGDQYSAWGAYGRSKLANVLFSKSLAQRLPEKVACVSVHPGVIRTPLWRSTPASGGLGGWLLGVLLADKNVPQGAATTLWGCLSDEVRRTTFSGAYLSDCARGSVSSLGSDEVLAEKLWQATEAQLDAALAKRGLSPDGSPL